VLKMLVLIAVLCALLLLVLYLNHVNNGMTATPPEALKESPQRWTDEEIKATFNRVCANPIDIRPHLPPRRDRRYIIVGGSGLVGGAIVLQLLARGQSPESIRIVDFRSPVRKDLLRGEALKVQYVHADVTKEESVQSALEKLWPAVVQSYPLTVFHTAAIILPGDRARAIQSHVSNVNVVGTAHVISAARAAGADLLVATSSGSIAIRPCNFWIAPWQKVPTDYVQHYPDAGKDQNLRPRNEYAGNYAISKAHAEDLVCKANNESGLLRTACIRPACGVYGNRYDLTVGAYLNAAEQGLPT
jgi:nucleoside-diphosphate-sugar epimerase